MNTILDCGHPESDHSPITTGYATLQDGSKLCYDCAAKMELSDMRKSGSATLYLVKRDNNYHVTNWTGAIDFKVTAFSESWHNMGGTRTDVWFTMDGREWHGYQIGDFTQICHCKRNK